MPLRLLLLAAFLIGCSSNPTVVQQTLVKCPAVLPDLECEEDMPPREGFLSDWFIDMSLWAGCYIEQRRVTEEAWADCGG